MTRTSLFILFAVLSVCIAAVLFLPLRTALDWSGLSSAPGLSVQMARGTAWRGKLDDVRYRGLTLGSTAVRTSFFSVLSGAPEMSLRWRAGSGRVALASDAVSVKALNGRFDISALSPIAGIAAVRDAAFYLESGKCQAASGQIDIQLSAGAGYTGTVACIADQLGAQLSGPGGAKVNLVLRSDGRFVIRQ